MIYPIAKALAIFGPVGVIATVLLNVLEASRPVTLVTVLTLLALGSVYCASIEAPRSDH